MMWHGLLIMKWAVGTYFVIRSTSWTLLVKKNVVGEMG